MKGWDSKGLWLKSKSFADKAHSYGHGSTDFAFWSGLALESLARAALTSIHPALNADPREDTNLLYAFGFNIVGQARSLPAHSVYLRLQKIIPKFGKIQRELCDFVAILRNQHLHTSELPYDSLKISKWLPRYYETISILNEFLGKELKEFLGKEIAASADKQIAALGLGVTKAVKSKVAAHLKVFEAKTNFAKTKLKTEAEIAVKTLSYGSSSQACPACEGLGIVTGALIKELEPTYADEQLTVTHVFLANDFKCLVCELTLKGLDELVQAEMETQFSLETSTSLHDLYEPEHYEEYNNM